MRRFCSAGESSDTHEERAVHLAPAEMILLFTSVTLIAAKEAKLIDRAIMVNIKRT
jgi:hypothetical protein